MATTPPPFADPAEPILRNAPAITDEDRASLWDTFHSSKDPDELARQLQTLAVPDPIKNSLYEAKKAAVPVTGLSKATEALKLIGSLDPKLLQVAEEHPNVLKSLMTAATAPDKGANVPEKGADASSGASKPAGKEKTSSDNADASETAPMPSDIPPTPPGHALLQTSDYALHHVPNENVAKVKLRDPKAQILHVEP